MKLTPTIRNTAHSEKNRKNINGLENKTNMDPCDIYIFIISFGGPQSIINIKGSLFLINEGLSGMTKCLEHTYTNNNKINTTARPGLLGSSKIEAAAFLASFKKAFRRGTGGNLSTRPTS